jgi:hypothetical protein
LDIALPTNWCTRFDKNRNDVPEDLGGFDSEDSIDRIAQAM